MKRRWLACAVFFVLFAFSTHALDVPFVPTATNRPVVIVHDAQATRTLLPVSSQVEIMVRSALTNLTGATNVEEAWKTLLSTQDVVGVKVFSRPGPDSGTRPAVASAVVQELLKAGLPATNIVIWDQNITDLRNAGYVELGARLGVSVQGAMQAGYDDTDYYESSLIGSLRFGDLEFGKKGDDVGRRSFVTKLLTHRFTKVISIAPALNENEIGVTGHLFSMAMGSVDNTWRFESNPSQLSIAIPEIYAKRSIGDKVVLCITDALICQYEGEETTLLHYSTTANELFFSKDPVVLDVLTLRLLEKQRQSAESSKLKLNTDVYRNAALLELGSNDPDRVAIRRITIPSSTKQKASPSSLSASQKP